MVEVHPAVGHGHQGPLRVGEGRGLLQHLADPLGAGNGHGDHDEDHGEHHQAHKHAHDIAEQAGQVSGGQLAGHDVVGAEPGQGQDGAVNHQHHDGTVQGQGALGLDEQAVKAVRRLFELLILVGSRTKALTTRMADTFS